MNVGTGTLPIQLRWREQDRKVLIEPEDEVRTVRQVGEVIAAAKIGFDAKATIDQVPKLLNALALWTSRRGDRIEHAFVTIRDMGLMFLIVRKQTEYDEQLEDELTQLDVEVANNSDFDRLQLSVLALPLCSPEQYESFVDPSNFYELRHA